VLVGCCERDGWEGRILSRRVTAAGGLEIASPFLETGEHYMGDSCMKRVSSTVVVGFILSSFADDLNLQRADKVAQSCTIYSQRTTDILETERD
jgi:hypothetical protein